MLRGVPDSHRRRRGSCEDSLNEQEMRPGCVASKRKSTKDARGQKHPVGNSATRAGQEPRGRVLPRAVVTQDVLQRQSYDRQRRAGRVVHHPFALCLGIVGAVVGNPLGNAARSKPNGSGAGPVMDDKNTLWKHPLQQFDGKLHVAWVANVKGHNPFPQVASDARHMFWQSMDTKTRTCKLRMRARDTTTSR